MEIEYISNFSGTSWTLDLFFLIHASSFFTDNFAAPYKFRVCGV